MNIHISTAVIIALLCCLLLATNVLAMSSLTYKLEWFTPLTSDAGGEMASASYKVNVTIGQSVIGNVTSANNSIGLGYWYGLLTDGAP